MPKIENFSEMIDKFLQDNEIMRECIRKFDEDISIKANKGELITMRTHLETKFISLWQWDEVKQTL